MSALVAALTSQLAEVEAKGLRRERRVLQSPQRARVTVDGRDYLAFCSNDYLGLAAHPELIAAACEGAQRYGLGAGASHLILGHSAPHHALEQALACFVELPAALFFSTGYMANLAVLTVLAGRGDAIFADKLNHASLNDAALLSRGQFKRYAHGDLKSLERALSSTKSNTKVIVSDTVFSMDGDVAPVEALLELAARYDAWLVLDDAHGFGVLGAHGRGILEHTGVRSPRIAYVGTLGKAAGVYGAFVAGERELIEMLVQRARTYIYTTASPPLIAHALLKSLELIARESARRAHLRDLIARLRQGLQACRWKLLPSHTPIQPLVIGESRQAVTLSGKLAERGMLVPAIRPPTVPASTARLRISLSADHAPADVDELVHSVLALQDLT